MGVGQEVVDLLHHLERRTQADPVVSVDGMHGPGLDDAPVQAIERLHHAAGEFMADLDVGAGDAFAQTRMKSWVSRSRGTRLSTRWSTLWKVNSTSYRFEPPGECRSGRRGGTSTPSEQRADQFVDRRDQVFVIGQGQGDRALAGGTRLHALGDELAGMDQQAGGGAFLQTIALEVTRHFRQLQQFGGGGLVQSRFVTG